MFSTAADMLAFYQMTLDGGSYQGVQILSRASVEVMTAPLVSVPPGGPISAFGLGWWVVQEPVWTIGLPLQSKGSYGHAGYWGTMGWVDPRTGLVGVFLVHYNSTAPTGRRTHVRAYAEVFIAMATAAIVADHDDH
jgi:CubicO group peptidase (beta-lactamase class C family)